MKAPSPTPYPEVNRVLLDLAAQIRSILGGRFVSLALYGSLALGDFDPDGSDIDFIVVTDGELSDLLVEALQAMHEQFDRCGSPWSGRVEAAYIPLGALNQPASSSAAYPQVEKGTVLRRAPLESGWAFQRHSLRKHGVLVAGRDLRPLIDPVAFTEMQAAALAILQGWLDQSRQDNAWIAWARLRSSQAFIVLTACRCLYTLESGEVASKPAAARWAQEMLKAPWEALIERCLAGQHDPQETRDEDYNQMLGLLNYALEQRRQNGFAYG